MISVDSVKKQAKKIALTNTANLYKKNNDIYKVIDRYTCLYADIVDNILYNLSINEEVSPNIILPTELIIGDHSRLCGYKCDYVNGKNLGKLAKDLSVEEKIILLNRLTTLLQEINQFLVVGDINLANCMYDKNLNGYLVDFDLSTKIGKTPLLMSYYNFVNKDDKDIRSNLSTDKLKMAVIAASLLYAENFEDCFVFEKKENAWDIFLYYTNNSFFKDYFETALHNIANDKSVTDYLIIPQDRLFRAMIEEDKKHIRKLVK